MTSAPPPINGSPIADVDLEQVLGAVEAHLAGLGAALLERNSQAVDIQAVELHRALAHAVDHFSRAARHSSLPQPLRHRLMQASSQVAAQRESFARATAALDRAIEVLLPSESGGLYSSVGGAERSLTGGSIQA
ncbi:MAG: hypothetical protein OEM00_00080 [Burkholderiaceae bacterium]|nr:hypothetical protein [Burkholderiaceae bacterium]MDH3459382.1 hypothetical protein [Burkholderiaceae bacterium]